MSDRGCWMYAVTDRDAAGDLAPLAGVPGVAGVAGTPEEAGAKVRVVRAAGLIALVSDVGLDEFGAEALRRNLEDLDWLEEVARAHHHVIDAASRLVSLLPVRLATVYSDDAGVVTALRERQREFTSALARVRGRAEWGVKAYARPASQSAAGAPAASPAGATTAGAGAGTAGAGMSYLKRRRDELAARQKAQRDASAGAREIHAELAGRAVGARLHPPQSPQLSGAKAAMLLNAAYLIGRSDGTGFAAAVASAAQSHPELRLEVTGPWPPYSFAEAARGAGGEAQ